MYRSRPRAANPFGDVEPATESEDLDAVLTRAKHDRDLGLDPIVERYTRGAGWSAHRPIVLCDDLRKHHLAREVTESYFDQKAGKMRTSKRWQIEPEGQRAITEAATADPLDFNLAAYAVNR